MKRKKRKGTTLTKQTIEAKKEAEIKKQCNAPRRRLTSVGLGTLVRVAGEDCVGGRGEDEDEYDDEEIVVFNEWWWRF